MNSWTWSLACLMLALALPGCSGTEQADDDTSAPADDDAADDDAVDDCGGACGPDDECVGGECVPCIAECDTPGDVTCAPAPDVGVLVCSNYDNDSCLEWGGYTPCTGDDVCTDGACGPECVDECSADGDRDCTAQLDGWVLCSDHDNDGCLEWSGVTSCDSDEICEAGECVEDCTEPGEECEDYDECCDDGDQPMHCCPVLHICVEDWWV